MQCARPGSHSVANNSLRGLVVAAWVVSLGACSLQGEGTGRTQISAGDDSEIDSPTGARRDAGLDAAADARATPANPRDASPDAEGGKTDAGEDRDAEADAGPAGDAGSDAEVAPDAHVADAQVADAKVPDAGPACDMPGTYAARMDFDVKWVPTTLGGVLPVLKGGQGLITMFATVRLAASGASVVVPCGTTVPDFESTDVVGAELYGGDIPVTAWDAPTMPSYSTHWATSCDRPGCSYAGDEATFVIGARPSVASALWPAQGGWDASGQYEATDDDNDGRPGITMITRGPPMTNVDGREYSFPPVGLAQYGRARKLMLAMSLRLKLAGELESCDAIKGRSSDAEVHVSAIGCTGVYDMQADELVCAPEVAQFVDTNLPMWTVQGASLTMRRLPPGGGCYTARALLSEP